MLPRRPGRPSSLPLGNTPARVPEIKQISESVQQSARPARLPSAMAFRKTAAWTVLYATVLVRSGPAEQGMADTPSFTAEVKVVNVLATVRDRSGRLRTDLQKKDFILEEDGVRQEIEYFSPMADAPLRLGLLFDSSMSQVRLMSEQRTSARTFVKSMIREEQDLAFLISFAWEVELLQDFTRSHDEFSKSIEELNTEALYKRSPPMLLRRSKPAGTLLYDAVFLAADEMFQGRSGRKTAVIVSDGHDQGSRTSLPSAVTAAQRSDVVIYTILHIDDEFAVYRYQEPQFGPTMLQHLSEQTGGSFFRTAGDTSLAEVFETISEEMRAQYSFGYTPSRNLGTSGFRRISLRCRNGKLTVKARKKYFWGGQ